MFGIHRLLLDTIPLLDYTSYFQASWCVWLLSFRTTSATQLFDAGVNEQIIVARTGHSSTSGASSYKRISHKLCDEILNGQPVQKVPATGDVHTDVSTTSKENIQPEKRAKVSCPEPAAVVFCDVQQYVQQDNWTSKLQDFLSPVPLLLQC